jgi:N4-gp56 family major capsid protein
MVDTLTSQSLEQANIYDRELLYRARQAQVFYDAGQKKNIRRNDGNTIRWRRFNSLGVNTSTLTEGVTPSSTALSLTEVTATVAQYGAYGEVSDMLDLVGIDPVIMEATAVFGQMAGESIEAVVVSVLAAGTSVIYATGSARNAQGPTNVITVALIRKAVRNLDRNNTLRFNGQSENAKIGSGTYMAFLSPSSVYDLKQDTEWKTMQQNIRPESLFAGSIGMVEGCQIIQTTLAPVFAAAGSSSNDVHGTLICGQHAFGVVDVAGTGKFNTYVKQLGSGGTSDPLDQRATIGWKSVFASKILNDNFMTRIEHGVTA